MGTARAKYRKPINAKLVVDCVVKNTGIGYRKKQSVVVISFYLLKKAKMFLMQKIVIFIFLRFKVLSCTHLRIGNESKQLIYIYCVIVADTMHVRMVWECTITY